MTWKTAIEERMKSRGINKSTLAEKSGLSKVYITLLLHKDDAKRKTGLSLEAADRIASALGTNGPQLWKEAKK